MSNDVDRRTILKWMGATAAVPASLASCSLVATSAPAAMPYLADFAVGLLSSAAYDLTTEAAKYGISWSTEVWQGAVTKAHGSDKWCYDPSGGYTTYVARNPVLFVATTKGSCESDSTAGGDICCVIKGKPKALILPTYAWQTLLLFRDSFLKDQDDAQKTVRRNLLKFALAPADLRPRSSMSPLGLTAACSYRTPSGWVDLGRVREPDGSYTGRIQVSGIDNPEKPGTPYVGSFPLPTTAT